jgi:hypothetical protein
MDRLSAVEESIRDMPTVLCALIDKYADLEPHEWKSGLAVDASSDDGRDAMPRPAWSVRRTSPFTSELACNYGHRIIVSGWYRFVSAATVRFGRRSWTIVGCQDRYIGAGVTTRSEGGSGNLNDDASWILTLIHGSSVHNGRRSVPISDKPSSASTIHFTADPATRQVTARFGSTDFVLMTAKSADEFDALRPVVVIGETSDVSISS